MLKLATVAALMMTTAAAAGEFDLSPQCYDAEDFADIAEYSETINYIGTGVGETDRLGYTHEFDILEQNGQYFVAQYNPYEHMTCVQYTVPGKQYQIYR